MTQLLDPGGQRASPQYALFEDLCVRAFLAVRAIQNPGLPKPYKPE